AAPEAQVVRGRLPSTRDRLHVVVLQARTRLAALALLAHERALPAIALADRALDRRGDVPALRNALLRPRPVAAPELLLLELLPQLAQRAPEHLRDISRGQHVAEERLHSNQLLVHLLIHRELHRVLPGRERNRSRARRKWLHLHPGIRLVGWDNWPYGQLRRGCIRPRRSLEPRQRPVQSPARLSPRPASG